MLPLGLLLTVNTLRWCFGQCVLEVPVCIGGYKLTIKMFGKQRYIHKMGIFIVVVYTMIEN